jgi:uncharacterized protein (TIGR01777 family)
VLSGNANNIGVDQNMKIVVAGATGFVGTPLVRDLLAAGHSVTALSRDVGRAARRLPARCRVLGWDAARPLEPSALRGADAVVHLAGEGIADTRWSAARKRAIRASRVDTSAALVHALGQLRTSERPRVLVSASAIGWYGDQGDTLLDERSAPGTGFLADVCSDWEQAVFKAQALGVRTVAVRIGVVLGRDGGALVPLLPLFRLGLGGRVGSGRQWFSWIHLQDLVGLLRYVVEHPDAAGPINGVAPEPVTNATFTAELGRALRRPTLFPVPAAALRVAFGAMSAVLLGSQRVQPQAAQRLGFAFRHPTLRSALEDLCADLSHELIVEQPLARRPEEVFPFFSDLANLERITPAFLRFRVLGTTTAPIGKGTLINYALRLHGIPLRWQSRIESWAPNRLFVDVQTRGPYALWHHTHEFEPDDGGTIIRDRVRYRLPFGALGDWLGGGLVRRDLAAIFDFRRQRIQELLG